MTQPTVRYSYSRLCFKANLIEPLRLADTFRVDTPDDSFQMSKAEFYNVFSNVVATKSYLERGLYHYPTVPRKALRFLVK